LLSAGPPVKTDVVPFAPFRDAAPLKKPFDDLERWVQRVRIWAEAADARIADLRRSRFGRYVTRLLLAADSWLDSSLYESGRGLRGAYETFAMFMDRFHVSRLRRLGVELACEAMTISIAVGLLLLALALPAFELTSEDWLKKQDLAVTFLDRYGQEVGRRGILHDDAVAFDELPPNLVHAVIATEDRRFFDHFGIDIIGTLRALTVNTRANGVVQGGSSLTQQLAKNLFLSNERTFQRKVNEAFLALWLEWHLSKREILSLYLDRAYLGGGTFGVQAASEFYFGKSVRDLTLPEAAMIAGLFKAPTKYAPHINLPAARARANDVLNNLVDAGYLTSGQIYAAQRNPATPVDRQAQTSPDWYLDWAYDEVKALADAGKFGTERVLTVRTALDPGLQQHTEDTIENELRQYGPAFHAKQAASVILEPNGAVRAIVGGRDYGASQFNRATDALRQPGSSFKPYVYLTALMTGRFRPDTPISGASLCLGNWCPHNYNNESAGRLPLVSALAMSLNTVAVRLSIEIGEGSAPDNSVWLKAKAGRAKIVATARRMGITTPLPDTVSLPLGADAVKVIDQAASYAVFANGGKRVPPYAAVSVMNGRGDVIYDHDRDQPKPQQVIDPDAIAMMNTMLHQVVLSGTGRRANFDGFQVSGKTGTTNNYHDAWFVGFTGNYVCAVWYGNDDYTSMNQMTGGTLPAATWHELMTYAHQNLEPKPVPGLPPPGETPRIIAESVSGGNVGDTPPAILQRPATLSKASVAVLGTIASSMHVAEMGRVTRPQEMQPAHPPAQLKKSDNSSSRFVELQ
jgi:penicillin-binding protein 1A